MAKPFSPGFKKGIAIAFYEYLIVTMPVGLYVVLEVLHRNDWRFSYRSPEWSIATIFLAFVSINKYRSAVQKSGKKAYDPILGIIAVFSLVLIIAATLNAYISMGNDTRTSSIIRIILFLLASSKFFILYTGSSMLIKPNENGEL